MENTYIKIYRGLSEWEWFTDSKMVHLFVYLLISANHSKGSWRGQNVERGQLITGLNSLMKSTGIEVQSIRTCLRRLKSTGEITIKSTNRFSVITIVKYDSYQSFEKKSTSQTTNNLTNNQQATNKQLTTNNNDKNNKKNKEYNFSFKKNLMEYGFNENLIDDWIKVRSKKKAANTETAYNQFISEIKKRNCDLNEVLTTIVSNSWQGFKWEWIDNLNKNKVEQPKVMVR